MFDLIFQPIKIGTMEISNRILMPALGTLFSTDQKLNERYYRWYERRAQGGAGVIVAGPTGVDFLGAGTIALSISDDSYIPAFEQLANRIHLYGTKAMIQLFHGGRYTFSMFLGGDEPVAPSAVRSQYTGEVPREMTLKDIEQVQDAFAAAALRAKKAGLDGVELIGSAGYLISQFLSPVTNLRTDQYGGSFENRGRFAVETIQKVRAAVGKDFTVTIRVAGNDFVKGGNTNKESARYCQLFEKAGVNAINVTGGWHEAFLTQLTMEVPRAGYAYLAAGIKRAVTIPVIASNRITDPYTAEYIISEGIADMVSLGRVLVADPDWPRKAREGRPDEIRPCVGCMQGCLDRIFTGQSLCCLVNAEAGLEEEREIKPARQPKRVVVIGAGAGGMEAARVAAIAGHQVHLYDKRSNLGGQLLVAGTPPGRHEFLSLADYYRAVLERLGVKTHLGVEVDAQAIAEMQADAVIVAEGATPIVPNIQGVGQKHVITSWDFLEKNPPVGGRVAVIGGGAVGLETALLAAKKGTINAEVLQFLMFHKAESDEKLHALIRKGTKQVTVFEMLPRVGQDIGKSSRWVLMNELKEFGVRIIANAKVESIEPDAIVYEQDGEKKKEGFDTVILAVGSAPQRRLMEALTRANVPYKSVGDCNAPRKILDAVHEGYLAAMELS